MHQYTVKDAYNEFVNKQLEGAFTQLSRINAKNTRARVMLNDFLMSYPHAINSSPYLQKMVDALSTRVDMMEKAESDFMEMTGERYPTMSGVDAVTGEPVEYFDFHQEESRLRKVHADKVARDAFASGILSPEVFKKAVADPSSASYVYDLVAEGMRNQKIEAAQQAIAEKQLKMAGDAINQSQAALKSVRQAMENPNMDDDTRAAFAKTFRYLNQNIQGGAAVADAALGHPAEKLAKADAEAAAKQKEADWAGLLGQAKSVRGANYRTKAEGIMAGKKFADSARSLFGDRVVERPVNATQDFFDSLRPDALVVWDNGKGAVPFTKTEAEEEWRNSEAKKHNMLEYPTAKDTRDAVSNNVFSIPVDKGVALVPALDPDGNKLDPAQAQELFKQNGVHYGVFEDMTKAANYLRSLDEPAPKPAPVQEPTPEPDPYSEEAVMNRFRRQ